MNIKNLVEESGYVPKRKAACHGGEYYSPCPFCKDGHDRFLILPNRHNNNGEYQGGRFSCRKCGKYGDAITFLCELHGLSYLKACAQLKIKPRDRQPTSLTRHHYKQPPIAIDPPALWLEKATAFVNWCHLQLMNNPAALSKVQERGFSTKSITRHKIGFNPGDIRGYDFRKDRPNWGLEPEFKEDGTSRKLWLPVGFTIPTLNAAGVPIKVKIRRTAWKEGDKLPKYVEVSGSKSSLSVYGDTNLPVGLILESEFDALLLQQEAADLLYCIALGGNMKPIDHHTNVLIKRTKTILFLPDFDEAGATAWVRWKRQYPYIHQILAIKGKSAGDAFLEGINLKEWIKQTIAEIDVNTIKAA